MRLRRLVAACAAISVMVVSGCSVYETHVRDSKITAEAITEACDEPIDFHFIPPGMMSDVPYRVILSKDCLGVERMLVIAWPGERNELRETYAHYLALLYAESRRNSSGQDRVLSLIKRVELSTDPSVSPTTVWFSVYELAQSAEKK